MRIRYECMLANILYANDYNEDEFLVPGITIFNPIDSDNDVHQKLLQLQELCVTCGQTPADELNENTLMLLRTFGFGGDQPKKKLMLFLGMRRSRNAVALQALSNEWTARLGLNELANEGIYEIDTGRSIESAVSELRDIHDRHLPNLTNQQETTREQICARLWQVCDEAASDFSLDEQIDKKTFKRGHMAAKVAAKFSFHERLPELNDDMEWAKRKKIVDDHNAHGGHLSYWDHLLTHEWTPTFNAEFKEQEYVNDFNRIYEDYLGPIRAFIRNIYPTDMRSNQMCAVLIYWHLVETLEAAFFLTRWLLPWDRMEWNNIKQMLATTCFCNLLLSTVDQTERLTVNDWKFQI